MPLKPYPTLLCVIQIMKTITLAISWQIYLPQVPGKAPLPMGGDWESTSRVLAVEQLELRGLCA